MTDTRLNDIFNMARKDKKRNMFVYEYYKQKVERLLLEPREYEQAMRKLAEILKV